MSTHDNPASVKSGNEPYDGNRSVRWTGDNIADVRMLLPHDNPPQYLSGYTNSDAIVGVWTPRGLEVAQLGDTIAIGEDGHPRVGPMPRNESFDQDAADLGYEQGYEAP